MKLEEGMSSDKADRGTAEESEENARYFYYMDTLTYLRKGGRIGLVTLSRRQHAEFKADYLL